MDIVEDLQTTTFSNNESFFKRAASEIESLRAQNDLLIAALNEAREDIVSFRNHDWYCKAALSNYEQPCTCWHQKAVDSIDTALAATKEKSLQALSELSKQLGGYEPKEES